MSHVRLHELEKSFNQNPVVRRLTLEIQEGEFFSLLGPSGCGKTTTLRMIAGFETPEQGRVYFNDEEVTRRKPNERNTGMVFQNYALFPHLNVFENVAFGLQARQAAPAEIASRVREALQLVEMAGMENRPVTQLSGGQQQRVALARALAIHPAILLLDEPLSNLDAQLRKTTRTELKRLQRRLGITTIYVTHDQDEALALSDRIAVMHEGIMQQVGTPQEIYHAPKNLFVMNFIGSCNVLRGRILEKKEGHVALAGEGWRVQLPGPSRAAGSAGEGATIAFRPEHVRVTRAAEAAKPEADEVVFDGLWQTAEFAGTHWLISATIGGAPCSARAAADEAHSVLGFKNSAPPTGERIKLRLARKNVLVFDHE